MIDVVNRLLYWWLILICWFDCCVSFIFVCCCVQVCFSCLFGFVVGFVVVLVFRFMILLRCFVIEWWGTLLCFIVDLTWFLLYLKVLLCLVDLHVTALGVLFVVCYYVIVFGLYVVGFDILCFDSSVLYELFVFGVYY